MNYNDDITYKFTFAVRTIEPNGDTYDYVDDGNGGVEKRKIGVTIFGPCLSVVTWDKRDIELAGTRYELCNEDERKCYIAMLSKEQYETLKPFDSKYCADVIIMDRKTGKEHKAVEFLNLSDEDLGIYSLNDYMYWGHYCPCHREGSIIGDVEDPQDVCEHGRYLVKSVTHPSLPGVNLYFEEWSE